MAMNEQELAGALLFFDKNKANCVSCHTGPALNATEFHALGMHDLDEVSEMVFMTSEFGSEKSGRGGFTGKAEDLYKFKVPQLYNLKDSPFYGHGSSFRNLRDLMEYKNAAVAENTNVPSQQLADDFVPLGLDETPSRTCRSS